MVRPNSSNIRPSQDREFEQIKVGQHGAAAVKREQKIKRDDYLTPLEGDMKNAHSDNKINYQRYENIKRPEKAKAREDFIGLPTDAKMEDGSESRTIKHSN